MEIDFTVVDSIESKNIETHIKALGMATSEYTLIVENGSVLRDTIDTEILSGMYAPYAVDFFHLGNVYKQDPRFVTGCEVAKTQGSKIVGDSAVAYAIKKSYIPKLIHYYKLLLKLGKTETMETNLDMILMMGVGKHTLITNPSFFYKP